MSRSRRRASSSGKSAARMDEERSSAITRGDCTCHNGTVRCRHDGSSSHEPNDEAGIAAAVARLKAVAKGSLDKRNRRSEATGNRRPGSPLKAPTNASVRGPAKNIARAEAPS